MSITTEPHRGRNQHPSSGITPSRSPNVVPLNDSAVLFMALAAEIRGTAVGLSPSGLELLRHGLEIRFGHLLGNADDSVYDHLVELASTPAA